MIPPSLWLTHVAEIYKNGSRDLTSNFEIAMIFIVEFMCFVFTLACMIYVWRHKIGKLEFSAIKT